MQPCRSPSAARPEPAEGPGSGWQQPRGAEAPHDGYLLRAADEAEKGRVVRARPEGSVVVALPVGPVAQHKVRGDGEVEHGRHVGAGLLAGVEGLRLPQAGAFHRRDVVRRGHDELVLPARQAVSGPGQTGMGREARRRLRASAAVGKPFSGLRRAELLLLGAALTLLPRGDGRWGGGEARPSLGMGRCHGRCSS